MGKTHIFNRKDIIVQQDATDMELPMFQAKYKESASALVLKAVWTDTQRQNAKGKEISKKATTAADLVPVSSFVTKPEGVLVEIKKDPKSRSIIVETDTQEKPKKGKKVDKLVASDVLEKEEGPITVKPKAGKAPLVEVTPATAKTRAVRLRELIAQKLDKKAATAILVKEGYDVKTIHSEWNRLNK